MQKSKNTGCASCGGQYRFSPEKQALACQKCGRIVEIEKDVNYSKHHLITQGEIPELTVSNSVSGHCSNCGAVFTSKGNKISNICDYCGSSVIIEFSNGDVLPDACIPFAFEKEKAKEYYRLGVKKAKFVPNSFKKDLPDDNIEAIYFPAFKFDFDTVTNYQGTLVDKDSDDGETHYHYHKISGTYASRDYDLMIECSDYLTQSTLQTLYPYNMQGLYKFKKDFVLGYSVEHFNRTMKDMRQWAINSVKNSIRTKILNNYSYDSVQYFDMKIDYKKSDYSYAILPAYKINYKFKGKEYNTYINGQTGKMGGKVPRSGLKITLFVLGILSVVAAVVGGMIALVN